MSAEWVAIIITIVGMTLGFISQALYITWHASRWNTTLEFMTQRLEQLSLSLGRLGDGNYSKSEAKDDLQKRDELQKRLWEKFDDLKDDFTLLRGKVDAHLIKEGENHAK